MDTHSMIFVPIDKLVSPSSSVNGDPLDNFPDHWQPRFSAPFILRRPSERADWRAPSKQKICPFSDGQAGGLLSRSRLLRDKMSTHRRASISRVTNGLGDPRFCWSRDRFIAQLFFGSNPVLDIFSVFAAALKIQLMSLASDLFSRGFSESNHCNLLGCQDCAGAPTDLRMRDVDYLPFAETLIFICFGLDSSRFAICRLKTPLRYSARTLSELTVFGREKLRVNGP